MQVWEERFGPNMTPMVDIVLVILIFFMAGTTFVSREWFLRSEAVMKGTAAPGADAMELPPVKLEISLSVDGSGGTVFGGLSVDAGERRPVSELRSRIAEFVKGTDAAHVIVVLVPTKEVAYRDVVGAHEACAAVGIERVGVTPPMP